MRHNARWAGILDHLSAAALYDGIKEHVARWGWPFWVGALVSIVVSLGAILIRPKRAKKEEPNSLTPTQAVDEDELLGVYFGTGAVEHIVRSSSRVLVPDVPVTLRIHTAGTRYCLLPLIAAVGRRSGIVLYGYKGTAVYVPSAACSHASVFNAIEAGICEVELDLPNGTKEVWNLEVGNGTPPALRQKVLNR